jgi:ketosteroid isomerase-like protein
MSDIQEFMDRLAIRELIDRYTVSVSKRDWDAVASCYLDDAKWVTSVGHNVSGIEAVREGIRGAVEARKFLIQMTHGMTIDSLTADTAETTSILNEFGTEGSVFVLGTYHDKIRKVGGQWKFHERFFQVHYIDTTEMKGNIMVDYAKLP